MAHQQYPHHPKYQKPEVNGSDSDGIEFIKSAAQSWHSHSTSSKTTTTEFDTHLKFFKSKPTRFKLEAMNSRRDRRWDFRQSLWDSYELVSVSKKLETGLVMGTSFSAWKDQASSYVKRQKESENSLRNLINTLSSRRFDETEIPLNSFQNHV